MRHPRPILWTVGTGCALLLSGCSTSAEDVFFAPDAAVVSEMTEQVEGWGLASSGEVLGACASASGLGEMFNYVMYLEGELAHAHAVETLVGEGFALQDPPSGAQASDVLDYTDSRKWQVRVTTVSADHVTSADEACPDVELDKGDTVVAIAAPFDAVK